MPGEHDSLVTPEELASILRAHEGPPGARSRPVARPAGRRFRFRWVGIAVGVALLAGSGLGFGLGSSLTPKGSAAESATGVGFLPERGWFVMQAGPATRTRQALAFAANVPFDPDDDIGALPGASGRPYATLEELPAGGIVIVGTFTLLNEQGSDGLFRIRRLPLRLRDAVPDRWSIGQVRERELAHYTLLAGVNGYDVELDIYFGALRPSRVLIAAAQRQLDRLVVRRASVGDQVAERAFPLRPTSTSSAIGAPSRNVDRTFVCTPRVFAGVRDLDIFVAYPNKNPSAIYPLGGYVSVNTGSDALASQLVYILARPLTTGLANRPRLSGVYAHGRRCAPVAASVPLASKGLPGPPARWTTETECRPQERVLIRVRARLASPASWRPAGNGLVGARRDVLNASVAIRGEKSRRPIAYLEMDEAGKTKLWTSSRCR